jgi:hypothetical protein
MHNIEILPAGKAHFWQHLLSEDMFEFTLWHVVHAQCDSHKKWPKAEDSTTSWQLADISHGGRCQINFKKLSTMVHIFHFYQFLCQNGRWNSQDSREYSFLGDRNKSFCFKGNMPESNGCHDVNIMGYSGVHMMAATSLGLSYMRRWLLWLWYDQGTTTVVSFVSLRLCVDFCSNILISLSIHQPNRSMNFWATMMSMVLKSKLQDDAMQVRRLWTWWNPPVPWCRRKQFGNGVCFFN